MQGNNDRKDYDDGDKSPNVLLKNEKLTSPRQKDQV